MSANGISHDPLKRIRQEQKLAISTSIREGKTVAIDGTVSGAVDSSKPAFRTANTLDLSMLPTLYHPSNNAGALVDNANTGGLSKGRPWKV